MEYKHFKKLHSDDECTTLQHPDGHELKIAHGKLSKKMKKELDKLPIHKAEGGPVSSDKKKPLPGSDEERKKVQDSFKGALGFSDGGEAEDKQMPAEFKSSEGPKDFKPGKDYSEEPLPGDPKASPVVINIGQPQPEQGRPTALGQLVNSVKEGSIGRAMEGYAQARTGGGSQPSPDAPNIAQDAPGSIAEPSPTLAPTPAPEAMPEASAPVAEAQVAEPVAAQVAEAKEPTPQDTAVATKQHLMAENQAFEQDLVNGHITPKTYSSMFQEKSTLGKIGMLFGMLLSGAGSGLTHQPNALAEMMDKEIERDLEAQKQSKANAQNFYRLNQQNLLNDAQVVKMKQEGLLNQSQAKQLEVETSTKAFALAQSQMLQSSFHSLVDKVNKMPEGPQKEAAKQQLGVIYPQVSAKINNINDQASGAAAYYKQLFGQGSGSGDEGEFQSRTSGMRMLGEQGQKRAEELESKHMPGLKGQASIPLTAKDRDSINGALTLDKELTKFRQWASQHSGSVNPKDILKGRAMAKELQSSYRMARDGGSYKEGESKFIDGIIDADPTKFFNSIRVLPKLDAVLAINKSSLQQLVKSKGFQGLEQSGSNEATKTVNGITYKRGPNGEAIRVK